MLVLGEPLPLLVAYCVFIGRLSDLSRLDLAAAFRTWV